MPTRIGQDEIPIRAIMATADLWQTATITIATDDDLSDEVDLGDYYGYLNVILPELTSADVSLQVSDESGGTFQDLDSATFAAGTGEVNTTFVLGGWRYLKVKTSASQAADREILVRGVTF